MREIKFRAWDKENKKMVYNGYFDEFKGPFGDYRYVLVSINLDGSINAQIPDDGGKNGLHEHDSDDFKKDRIELMQCTGLKDTAGREIFEGDFLRATHPSVEFNHIGYVQYNEEVAAFELYRDVYISMPLLEYDKFEIIGNIYENPELLQS